MKLLLDMNMSPRLVELLTGPECEVVSWASLGSARDPDHEIMAYAVANGYIVLTNDLDFGILLAASNAALPSVIQIRFDNLDPLEIHRPISDVLRDLRAELDLGALVTLDPKKTRVRVLPLRINK